MKITRWTVLLTLLMSMWLPIKALKQSHLLSVRPVLMKWIITMCSCGDWCIPLNSLLDPPLEPDNIEQSRRNCQLENLPAASENDVNPSPGLFHQIFKHNMLFSATLNKDCMYRDVYIVSLLYLRLLWTLSVFQIYVVYQKLVLFLS